MLKGIGVSPGIAIGSALVWAPESLLVLRRKIEPDDVEKQIERLHVAIGKARQELSAVRDRMIHEMGLRQAYIFEAHIMMLDDKLLVEQTETRIREDLDETAWALHQTLEVLWKKLDESDNEYIRQRTADISDVGKQIMRKLLGSQHRQDLSNLDREVIIVAHDLSPSDTAMMKREMVIGFATEIGGKTSHTAIMSRALEIPAIVGVENLLGQIQTGDGLILDGMSGKLFLEPGGQLFQEYLDRAQRYHYFERQLKQLKDLPPETTDGYRVELAANVELIDEIETLVQNGATSIGLYRTEFLYLSKNATPTEEEHYLAYRSVAEKLAPAPAIIRTFDLGGDKFISSPKLDNTFHSSLGLRAIRFCLRELEMFRSQLRGILRASVHGNLKIMFPMISTLCELRQAKEQVHVAMDELRSQGIAFDEQIEVGLMIEVPSAAIIADSLAKEADFFSVGTNDLIQYALAIDRVNEDVAYLYEPLHPAVLRMAKYVVDVGHGEGIWVGICGEMAADPAVAILLLGMGFDELSMNPVAIPRIKKVVRAFSYAEAVDLAEIVLEMPTAEEAGAILREKIAEKFPEGLY